MFWLEAPENVGMMQAVVRKIANFEFELDDLLKEDLWQFKTEEVLVRFYEQAGYDSNVLMFTMGLELYFFLGTVVLIFTTFLLTCLCMRGNYCKS